MKKIARLISVAAIAMALIIAFSGVASASWFVEEGTNVGFSIIDNGCLGASVGSQLEFTRGIAHSSTRAESGMTHTLTDYGFSSSDKERVEVWCDAVSISNTAHETHYSQHITADGEFNIYYSADISFRGNPLCPFGGAP